MAKRKRKPIHALELETPTIEQLRNGSFARDFVTHVGTNTKAMTFRRRDSSILEKWIRDEEKAVQDGEMQQDSRLFPVQAQRFIGDCITLWARIGSQRVTANYGERIPTNGHSDGMGQKEALDQLHRFKGLLGPYQRHYWPVFENVARHNEPAGVAGSHFANNPAQRSQSAKLIVSVVATDLAHKLGY
jgi:hypothetical protein